MHTSNSIEFRWLIHPVSLLVIILAIGLRVSLAQVNFEANDDQVAVAQLLKSKSMSEVTRETCWQCYHPKLFHLTLATISNALGAQDYHKVRQVGQWLSTLFSIAVVFVAGVFFSISPLPNKVRFIGWSGLVLNSRLIAIGAQATNDMLGILFASICTLAIADIVVRGKNYAPWVGMLFSLLAAVTKGNGIVTAVVYLISMGWLGFAAGRGGQIGKHLWMVAGCGSLALASIVWFVPPYSVHRALYGDPFIFGLDRPTPVRTLLAEESNSNPKAEEVFLTFRLGRLLMTPNVNLDKEQTAASLWTHLYGRATHVRFDRWPPSWVSDEGSTVILGRALACFGLLPLLLLAAGIGRALGDCVRVRPRQMNPSQRLNAIMGFAAVAYVAMIVTMVWRFPSYPYMKFIYILPGGIPLSSLIACGYSRLRWRGTPRWCHAVTISLVTFSALSVLDISLLVLDLSRK